MIHPGRREIIQLHLGDDECGLLEAPMPKRIRLTIAISLA